MEENKTTEESEYRKSFFDTIHKIEDDFEKKITQISVGALALSITFIDKIVDLSTAEHFWILIIGWGLLTLTLSINLISILISRKLNMQSLNDFDNKVSKKDLKENIRKRNCIITTLDLVSLVKLLLGIFCIVLFSSINIKNKEIMPENKKTIIEKGRIIQAPRVSSSESQTNSNDSDSSQEQNPSNDSDKKD